MPYTYKKRERLRKNKQFVMTMKGKRLSLDGLSLFYTRNAIGTFRVGISVSKKLANVVTRNRKKRQIRDGVMRVLSSLSQGYDLVFVARQGLLTADYNKILSTIKTILQRTVLYNHP